MNQHISTVLLSTAGESSSVQSSLNSQTELGAVLIKLLADAEKALKTDHKMAKDCIDRACALLRAGQTEKYTVRPQTPGASFARRGLAPWQIKRVTDHINANLASTIRLRDFTPLTRLSTSYFSRAFKSSVGESPYAFIVRKRIERAQEMMLATSEPLCQIALACGLSDQAHFSRLFRRFLGINPSAWRRQRRGPSPR